MEEEIEYEDRIIAGLIYKHKQNCFLALRATNLILGDIFKNTPNKCNQAMLFPIIFRLILEQLIAEDDAY